MVNIILPFFKDLVRQEWGTKSLHIVDFTGKIDGCLSVKEFFWVMSSGNVSSALKKIKD